MLKKAVWPGAPSTAAPYTPGVICGNLVFVSGQVPMDADTREIVEGDFESHVRQCITNVERVLRAAGTDLEHAVKVTVFLSDMDNFDRLNAVYREYWGEILPARTCIQAARLPLDVDIEIEAIAALPD